jgi:hypothetical protein
VADIRILTHECIKFITKRSSVQPQLFRGRGANGIRSNLSAGEGKPSANEVPDSSPGPPVEPQGCESQLVQYANQVGTIKIIITRRRLSYSGVERLPVAKRAPTVSKRDWENSQGLERADGLLYPRLRSVEELMVSDKIRIEIEGKNLYTTNWGLLKQPDKHESPSWTCNLHGPERP